MSNYRRGVSLEREVIMRSNIINELGNRYGKLLVVAGPKSKVYGGGKKAFWVCKCDCGETCEISGTQLRNGGRKSCGCAKKPNLCGQKFGNITVIENTEKVGRGGSFIWKCKCDCGNVIELETSKLTRKRYPTRQCSLCALQKKKLTTRCKHGHPFDKKNTGMYGSGKRYCKKCRNERAQKMRKSPGHKDWSRRYHLRKKYGLSLEAFNEMLEKQDNKCAICKCNFKRRCVDHNHKTGAVRGLLCHFCNTGLGRFKDQYQIVKSAEIYLSQEIPEFVVEREDIPKGFVCPSTHANEK